MVNVSCGIYKIGLFLKLYLLIKLENQRKQELI